MRSRDYTLEDEKNSLESFLRDQTIEVNHNYLRMEKGYKPHLFGLIRFSLQLRSLMLERYWLVFTSDRLVLLTQDNEYQFSSQNMVTIKYADIHAFSFEKQYGDYCIHFTYSGEPYYFYLTDRISSRLLDKLFHIEKKTYSYTFRNLGYLQQNNFRGLLVNSNDSGEVQ